MKKRLHLFIIILTLGFLLLPNLGYSCGTKSKSNCCSKNETSKKTSKSCCSTKKSKKSKDKCNGKCGHCNSINPTTDLTFFIEKEIEFKDTVFYSSIKKPFFFFSQGFISKGFATVWTPPKIK